MRSSRHGFKNTVFITNTCTEICCVFGKAYAAKIEKSGRWEIWGIRTDAKALGTETITRRIIFLVGRCNLLLSGISRKTSEYRPCVRLIGSFPPSTRCNTSGLSWHGQSSLAATPLEWLSNCRKWLLTDVRQYVGRSDYMCSFDCAILTQSMGANRINSTHKNTHVRHPIELVFFLSDR